VVEASHLDSTFHSQDFPESGPGTRGALSLHIGMSEGDAIKALDALPKFPDFFRLSILWRNRGLFPIFANNSVTTAKNEYSIDIRRAVVADSMVSPEF
jgi:hypothetical protein